VGTVVAIDAGSLLSPRTGVGRFVETLIDSLNGLPGHPIEVKPYVISLRGQMPPGTRRVPYHFRGAVTAWGSVGFPRMGARGAAVVHGPNYVVPPTNVASIVSVHDCWFLRNPETASGAIRLFGAALRRSVARGVVVHVPSAHTAREVKELLGATQVEVLPLGAPHVDRDAPVPQMPGVTDRPYVIATATREPRKNLVRLVQAFGVVAARHADLELVLVGPEGSDQAAIDVAIRRLPGSLASRVSVLPYVSDSERDGLVRGAQVMAFTSLDEGWGYPALEAMALGTPVVAANAGSLPEVCGGAALLVDPLEVDAIADGLERALVDAELRQGLVDRGAVRVAAYAPQAVATGFAGLYQRLAAEGR
jgi:glycosyltransferase involved in cell wall biosynthesis